MISARQEGTRMRKERWSARTAYGGLQTRHNGAIPLVILAPRAKVKTAVAGYLALTVLLASIKTRQVLPNANHAPKVRRIEIQAERSPAKNVT